MIGEKRLEEYYKGKLLLDDKWDSPLIDKILITLQTCTTEEIHPIDRASWFGLIYKELKKVPPVEIDQPIYHITNYNGLGSYRITYGYVSSIRQDKNKDWSFRYTYWSCYKNDNPLYPKIRDKSEKDKHLHEVKIEDLYIRGEYKGQMYFVDLEEAQKRLKELK